MDSRMIYRPDGNGRNDQQHCTVTLFIAPQRPTELVKTQRKQAGGGGVVDVVEVTSGERNRGQEQYTLCVLQSLLNYGIDQCRLLSNSSYARPPCQRRTTGQLGQTEGEK